MCTTKNKNTKATHPATHLIVFPMYYSTSGMQDIQHPVDKRWYYKSDPYYATYERLEGPAVLWKDRLTRSST